LLTIEERSSDESEEEEQAQLNTSDPGNRRIGVRSEDRLLIISLVHPECIRITESAEQDEESS